MRPLLTSASLLTLLFTACIGLIRAQPYDDSELRAFLTPPEGCPMPCFMGIRSGLSNDVATMDEAIAILEKHNWVGELDFQYAPTDEIPTGTIQWTWSGSQPTIINDKRLGRIQVEDLNYDGMPTVTLVEIPTRITFGQVYLLLGQPEYSWFGYDPYGHGRNVHTVVYLPGIQLLSAVDCPVDLVGISNKATRISFGMMFEFVDQYQSLGEVFPQYSRRFLREFPGC